MAKGKSIIHDYKFNFVDKIGPTYCGAKWYNATIWLGHGQTTSCHHPPSHPIYTGVEGASREGTNRYVTLYE